MPDLTACARPAAPLVAAAAARSPGNHSQREQKERGHSSTTRLDHEDGARRVWTVTTTITCTASRHDTIAAYKNHGCRCPKARDRVVDYQRRARYGYVLPSQPADVTVRRLQALAVLGWPGDEIARLVGRNPVSVTQLRRGVHEKVTGRTALAVFKVYRKLHDQPGPSKRTRSYAARQGWEGPSVLLWYPDVDDVAVSRACAGEPTPLTRAERLTAVEQLRRRGVGYDDMAERLRVSQRQVHRDLTDLGLILKATG